LAQPFTPARLGMSGSRQMTVSGSPPASRAQITEASPSE